MTKILKFVAPTIARMLESSKSTRGVSKLSKTLPELNKLLNIGEKATPIETIKNLLKFGDDLPLKNKGVGLDIFLLTRLYLKGSEYLKLVLGAKAQANGLDSLSRKEVSKLLKIYEVSRDNPNNFYKMVSDLSLGSNKNVGIRKNKSNQKLLEQCLDYAEGKIDSIRKTSIGLQLLRRGLIDEARNIRTQEKFLTLLGDEFIPEKNLILNIHHPEEMNVVEKKVWKAIAKKMGVKVPKGTTPKKYLLSSPEYSSLARAEFINIAENSKNPLLDIHNNGTLTTEDVHRFKILHNIKSGWLLPLSDAMRVYWDSSKGNPVIKTSSGKTYNVIKNSDGTKSTVDDLGNIIATFPEGVDPILPFLKKFGGVLHKHIGGNILKFIFN